MENVLKTERISEVVKVHPKYVAKNISEIVLVLLREKYEGKATEYGYIRRGSIKFANVSAAQVEYYSLHGYVNVDVVFTAQVFNPPKDSVIDTQIMDMNDFGYKASSFMDGESIIEIIIPKQLTLKHGIHLNPTIGDSVKVKIIDMRVDHMTKRLGAIACFADAVDSGSGSGEAGGHVLIQRDGDLDEETDIDADADDMDVLVVDTDTEDVETNVDSEGSDANSDTDSDVIIVGDNDDDDIIGDNDD